MSEYEEDDYSRAEEMKWLRIILFFYMGFGSLINCIGNIEAIGEYRDLPLWAECCMTFPALFFPIFAGIAIWAVKELRRDSFYIVTLYLAYNALAALLNWAWVPIVIDIVCFVYLQTSTVAREIWPSERNGWSRLLTLLTLLAVAGIVMIYAVSYC